MRGGQYQALLLLRGLGERGYSQILLANEQGPLGRAAKAAGHEVLPATFREVWRCSQPADTVVHAHDARAHTVAAAVSRAPFVVSRRVAFPVKRSFLSRWKYRRARRYLAVSQFVREMLVAAGVSGEKIDVVYDGVEAVLTDRPSSSPQLAIVSLASGDPAKGRALMEDAAALADVDVVYSDDLPCDLRGASLFVYLTRSEGLGSAALLAMSMGVPVIASRVGGLAEVFVHNESGLYVENNAEEIAGAIQRLLNNQELRQRLALGGLRRMRDRFTKEHMVENTIRAYERVLAE